MKTTLVVPVIEESLAVDKRTMDRGGYRIVKTVQLRDAIVDDPPVMHSVCVERRAMGRLLSSMEASPSRQDGNTLIVSVVEEVLVTEKRLMLKEELHITRTGLVTDHSQKFSLRSKDIVIERLEPGAPPVHGKL